MTNVPGATFGPLGFEAPSAPAVLAGVQADINAAFGVTLNYQLTTPQGQLASSEAALIVNANSIFVYYANQVDPAYATGRMQDAIARIYFLTRLPAEPTVLQVVCNGLEGVTIPLTATISDAIGNIYQCTATGTIGSSGNVTLPFAAIIAGPTSVPTEVSIYQSVPGWDSASVSSGVVGQYTETREQFENRRRQSVAKNSVNQLTSTLGAVLSVPGVLDAYVTENDLNVPVMTNGYLLAANSLYVAVVGGSSEDIAKAIWSKKPPGCNYNGNTAVTVYDETPPYSPPYPSYVVTFEIPESLPILFSVKIANGPLVPANAVTLIQDVIIAAFTGSDGGARARIGSTIYASRYVVPITLLGSWVQIVSLGIGSANTADANFVASISGTTMTVTSVASGAILIGSTVFGSTIAVTEGTTVLQQLTGSNPGGIGTYLLSISQTRASQAMVAITPNDLSVVVEIDQSPTISRANIAVGFA